MTTSRPSLPSTAFRDISWSAGGAVPASPTGRASDAATAGCRIGTPNAVAISRAIPLTDMQSGRLPVTSKSITASSPPSRSTPSTAKPRTDMVAAISSGLTGTSTKSRSQERRTFMVRETRPSYGRELLEESHVVLVEQADVLDAVFEHGHALYTGPEGESRDLLRVVADGLEHGGVDHAAAEDFEPAGTLADPASGPAAG